MLPQTHFLFTYALALIFSKLEIIDYKLVLPIAFLSFIIDIDHYISHVIHTKSFSFRTAWNAAMRNKARYERTFIHHETGFIIISLITLAMFFINYVYAYIIGIAYYTHMILDYTIPMSHKKVIEIKEKHYIIDLPKQELFFDIFLVAVIGVLYLI